ncbi:DDB1- and CUL4-associated factor 4 [Desmophyllum pertusum]|uniref:DDB1- and CUL4-associated factor 4 n=1 Tax=Desmophyllum pertusum TaxID=174260 RepID=A0A9X0CME3_9CNID|nr:DDB1- and CUL4-associated factor 4 [Desmophyllum pertusum]
MSQSEFFIHQAKHRVNNVASRGSPTPGRSKTFQLNIKMMNSNKAAKRVRKRSSRGQDENTALILFQEVKEVAWKAILPRREGRRILAFEISFYNQQYQKRFFYDPEKKRYFKITKDHPGKNFVLCQCGGWKDPSHNHRRVIPGNIKVTKKPSRISIVKDLSHREHASTSQTPHRDMLEKLCRLLKVKQKLTLDPGADNYFPMDSFSVSRIEPDACHERLLTLYETKPSGNQICQFHNLLNDKNNNLDVVHNMAMMKNQKITGLLWSPHKQTKNIYIASLQGYGSMSGETMIFEVDGSSQRIVGRCSVQGSTVWTNAWNTNPLYSNMISIGASKVALTLDVSTKRRVIHVKCDSDVFAQEFSWSNPVLYNGSRDGCIRTCDVRLTGSSWPVMCLRQGKLASITCIRVLHDENHLLASGLDGSLKMWDLRARACVQDYRGHVNEITHGLRFYVDPTDSLIFAAGQDSLTRIWSVRSGELIHSIPFPESVDKSLSPIPALYYSEEWGGKGGMPGLFYGAGDSIYSYSY